MAKVDFDRVARLLGVAKDAHGFASLQNIVKAANDELREINASLGPTQERPVQVVEPPVEPPVYPRDSGPRQTPTNPREPVVPAEPLPRLGGENG